MAMNNGKRTTVLKQIPNERLLEELLAAKPGDRRKALKTEALRRMGCVFNANAGTPAEQDKEKDK